MNHLNNTEIAFESAEYIHIKQNGDRLGLAFVSKTERPLGFGQAAVPGVIAFAIICLGCGGRSHFSAVVFVGGDRVFLLRASQQSSSTSVNSADSWYGAIAISKLKHLANPKSRSSNILPDISEISRPVPLHNLRKNLVRHIRHRNLLHLL
jgi:hypothetical protein